MAIHELYLLQPGVRPNQIAPRHHQYYGAIPNALADQSRCQIYIMLGLSLSFALTNQVLDLQSVVLHTAA